MKLKKRTVSPSQKDFYESLNIILRNQNDAKKQSRNASFRVNPITIQENNAPYGLETLALEKEFSKYFRNTITGEFLSANG